MDETRLLEKLRRIEALFAGAKTEGERIAAAEARARIQLRLAEVAAADPPVEYQFTLTDAWSRKVFVALLRRYELKPYRYPRQRYTTVVTRVSKRFVDETLWPEYVELNKALRTYLDEVTDRVVAEVLHQDASDAPVVAAPRQLGAGPILVDD